MTVAERVLAAVLRPLAAPLTSPAPPAPTTPPGGPVGPACICTHLADHHDNGDGWCQADGCGCSYWEERPAWIDTWTTNNSNGGAEVTAPLHDINAPLPTPAGVQEADVEAAPMPSALAIWWGIS